jgi:hypothetical protein
MIRLPGLKTSVLGAVLIAAVPTAAHAFVTLGVQWTSNIVGFRINPNFPEPLVAGTPDEQIEIIGSAATAWHDQSRTKFQFQYLGTTTKNTYNPNDGVNIVAWSNSDGGDALAATLVSGNAGVATSFDVLFFNSSNGIANHYSGPGEPASGQLDMAGVATHELGHGLGLGHTPIRDATMFASASNRALHMRTLHQDDRDAVESIYGLRTQEQPGPSISTVNPFDGPTTGGNEVLLTGVNFTYNTDTQLLIGGNALGTSRWNVESYTRLRITSMPSHASGAVSIQVTNTIGSITLPNAYHYGGPGPRVLAVSPSEGPDAGGIAVTIKGENFADGAIVTVDGKPLLDEEVVSSGEIRGVLPPSTVEGAVDVKLEQGIDSSTLADGFTYNPYFLRVADVEGAPGQTGLPLVVKATSPVELSSASFGFVYPKESLAVERVSTEGTAADSAEFVGANVQNDSGVTTVGIVMSFDHPTPAFPAGTDLPLARLLTDVAASAEIGSLIPVEIADGVGQPPIELIFTKVGSTLNLRPLTAGGKVKVITGILFVRGDANGDGKRDISDAVYELDFLFKGGPAVPCKDAADANDDGKLDLSDAIRLLGFLFQGTASLPAPFPGPGLDPTADALGCEG